MKFFSRKKKKKKEIDTLLDYINKERDVVINFIAEYGENTRYCSLQHGPCNTQGFFMWQKDAKGRYIFANERHCVDFCGLSSECTNKIYGMYDVDLINAFMERTGKKHTFIDCCELTDKIMREEQKQIRFIEIGYIGERLVLLDVTKTPVFNKHGKYIGCKGLAIDVSLHAKQTEELLELSLKNKSLKNVWHTSDSSVYQFVEDRITLNEKPPFSEGFPK